MGERQITFNIDELQHLQNAFCAASHLYVICIGQNSGRLLSFSGSSLEEDFVDQFFPHEIRQEIYDSFLDEGPESVVARDGIKDYIMYRGVAIRGVNDRLVGVWLVMGVNKLLIPDDLYIPGEIMRTTEADMDKNIHLLESVSRAYFSEKMRSYNLETSLSEVELNEKAMEHRLVKNEVITEILKMMESDNTFDRVSEDVLTEAAKYMNCTNAILLKLDTDDKTLIVVSEYSALETLALGNRFDGLDRAELPFATGRPYTISSDAMIPDVFAGFFASYEITAGIFLPISINGRNSMYLGFINRVDSRKWSVDDLKFANDVKRVIHNILIKRITKNSLASSYSALEAILENTGCGVSVNDINTHEVLYTNETFYDLFSEDQVKDSVNELILTTEPSVTEINSFQLPDSDKWYDVRFSNINWVDGRAVRLSTFYDITEIKAYQKRIEKQAIEDYLTGLYNRKRCESDISELCRYIKKSRDSFAILIIDLDDFTNINDALGHRIGDMLLRAVAGSLDNINAIKGHCYRAGGDEFIVVVTPEQYNNLNAIIRTIGNLFTKTWNLGEQEYYCTMSMGVVEVPKDGDDINTLMQRVDIALHDAKLKGKNRVEFYNNAAVDFAAKRLGLEKSMRSAVAEGCKEFVVYYQPVMHVLDDEVVCCGAEALVRWQSAEYGFVFPSDFIPLSEYLGLIVPIGEHVLKEATKRCKYWNDFGHPEYKVNVNLSIIQLMQPDILNVIKAALEESEIEPSNLTLEVTESLAINDVERMTKLLKDIKSLGCRIALDDFGTGYSSLSYIRSLPIDTIKIDRCFVKDINDDHFSNAFVRTMSDLADTLGMDVCCEGVEDRMQNDIVSRMHVNLIQGYYYDKPLPVDQFEKKYIL